MGSTGALVLDFSGIFFHRYEIAANAELREPKNTPSRHVWRPARLRVNNLFYIKRFPKVNFRLYVNICELLQVSRVNFFKKLLNVHADCLEISLKELVLNRKLEV